ncbi:serine dehydratase beta chain [Bradyrhizobium sp. RT9b]|uniref:serine dehydratase beta chain n=1 Tax=Bradyrhizobium sp. RT9b TaxID=3156385 RepID=UPI0033963249
MPTGILDLFKVGIGPSSSHTVGPMKAADTFVRGLNKSCQERVARIEVTVFGSLAWTGKGHATDKALVLGLSGKSPDRIDPDEARRLFERIRRDHSIELSSSRKIGFELDSDIIFDTKRHFDRHPNAMEFKAFDANHDIVASETWFSIGGGFIEQLGSENEGENIGYLHGFDFQSSHDLLDICRLHSCTIADIAMANELARREERQTFQEID